MLGGKHTSTMSSTKEDSSGGRSLFGDNDWEFLYVNANTNSQIQSAHRWQLPGTSAQLWYGPEWSTRSYSADVTVV